MSYPLLPTCSVHLVGVRWKTLWKREREGKRSGPQVYLTATKTLVPSKTFFRNKVSNIHAWYHLKRFLGTVCNENGCGLHVPDPKYP